MIFLVFLFWFFFHILRHIQISLKQMQIPVIQTQSGHAGTYRAMLPKLMSAVTTHTHLFITLKIEMQITFSLKPLRFLSSGLFFFLLNLENQARKLQTSNLILLFVCSNWTKQPLLLFSASQI